MKLKRIGTEFETLCPFHSERTPSFTINDAKGFGHCFGCGWHGDVIKLVMDRQGCDFREAYQRLANADLPQWAPIERAKAAAEDRLADLAKEQDARRFWKEAVPIAGHRARFTFAPAPSWHPSPTPFGSAWCRLGGTKETGEWGRSARRICGCEDGTGAVVGIQRIFFRTTIPHLARPTASCLSALSGARHCGSLHRPRPIIMAEGPEDGLSIVQEGPGHPVWVPLGTSMMPAVQLPFGGPPIIIAGQNNTAGRIAANKAALALYEQGIGRRAGVACAMLRRLERPAQRRRRLMGVFDHQFSASQTDRAAPQPMPIMAHRGAQELYPVSALGGVVGGAVRAAVEHAFVPPSLAAQSALAACSLAVQGYFNVQLPRGQYRPVSLNLVTVAESGDRKSTSDDLLTAPIHEYERELAERCLQQQAESAICQQAWDEAKKEATNRHKKAGREALEEAYRALGDRPDGPLEPPLSSGPAPRRAC
jgi:DNA primase